MKNVAIITARGGSKRIPRKNIRDFCGKPIMAYSIEAAVQSGLFSEVMVSTDDEEIAQIAIQYGAKVPFYRSEETSNDFAGTADVLKEVIAEYKKRGQEFDYMCCIYPTAPFVTAEKLQSAFQTMIEQEADCVSPYTRFSFPPQRGYYIRQGKLKAVQPKKIKCRSQDLEGIYHDVGQFYFYRMSTFGAKRGKGFLGLFGKTPYKHIPLEISDTEVQDIDNYEDWEIAELKYQLMVRKAENK